MLNNDSSNELCLAITSAALCGFAFFKLALTQSTLQAISPNNPEVKSFVGRHHTPIKLTAGIAIASTMATIMFNSGTTFACGAIASGFLAVELIIHEKAAKQLAQSLRDTSAKQKDGEADVMDALKSVSK